MGTWPVTQLFGENPQDYKYTNGHAGIDWGCPKGTNVLATMAGMVLRADYHHNADGSDGYGKHVRIQHENGWVSIYGHLSDFAVSKGQNVLAGEVIGASGNTGNSTGPHLHFEVRNKYGTPFDPLPYIEAVESPTVIEVVKIDFEIGNLLRVKESATPYLNVRNGSSRDAADIGDVLPGDEVTVVRMDGDWVCIFRAGNFACWVHGGYVERIGSV